jgi:hypothetical protein
VTWVAAIALATAAPACSFERVTGTPIARDADPPPEDTVVIGDASNDWWDAAWPLRRQITIKHTELTGPVQGFPLLVRLPAGVGRPDGADLRFIATDQRVLLPHELDKTDASGAVVWVRIPDLSNTGPAPVLWVYYGNTTAPSTSSGMAVFGGGHVSVHHLGQSLGDATGHGHTASGPNPGMTPNVTAGRIGDARDFDGNNDRLELLDEQPYDFTTSLSVSAWIRVQNLGPAYQTIVAKGDLSWRLHREDQTSFIGFGTTVAGGFQNQSGDMNIGDGAWHHVAIVFGSSAKQIFVDGQLDQTDAAGPTIDTNDALVAFGYNSEATTPPERYWNGDIDEVRISSAARDLHWMFAERHTVVTADFAQPGDEEMRPR